MKRLLAVLVALLALAGSAHASSGRLAIIIDPSFSAAEREACMSIIRRSSPPYTVYNLASRDWGASGKADSTWFRENFSAVLILGTTVDTNVATGFFATNFQDAAAAVGTSRSPLSGRWRIPVFVLAPHQVIGTTDAASDTVGGNGLACGIRRTSPAGSINKPSVDTLGTWRYRLIAKWGPTGRDTLYADPEDLGCIPAVWSGAGTKAALAYVDTLASCGGCQSQAGDTLAAVWRWRPHDGKPGIYYSTLRMSGGLNHGLPVMLQYIYSITDIRPFERIAVMIQPHNSYGTTDAARAVVTQTHSVLLRNRIPFTMGLPQVSATDYANPHTAATRAEMRRVMGVAFWSPGSNAVPIVGVSTGSGDTANVRRALNSVVNTATRSDSFALSRSRLRVGRYLGASGLATLWDLKALADAGCKIVESTLTTNTGTTSAIINPAGTYYMPHPHTVPGGGTENRIIYSAGTSSYADAATYTVAKGNEADHEYMGRVVAALFVAALQNPASIYWHAHTNAASADPYMAWYMARLASDFRLFNKVAKPDEGEHQVRTPRRR